jgi:hypothetical protein
VIKDQLKNASAVIATHVGSDGPNLAIACSDAAEPVLLWVDWYQKFRPQASAPELLRGARASVLEAVSYVGLGIGRGALTAIRLQVDLMLGFTYFREHPAEWRLLNWTGDGFKLRSEIVKYHREMEPGRGGFNDRLGIIDQARKPTLEECYRTLSAHVHGQSANTAPKTGSVLELIATKATLQQVVELQKQTADALSAYLLALHAREWNELPPAFVTRGKSLLTPEQQKVFFGLS